MMKADIHLSNKGDWNMPNNENQNDQHNSDINIEKRNVNRSENPGLVGATFVKYAAYIIILLIVIYFFVTYILPRI